MLCSFVAVASRVNERLMIQKRNWNQDSHIYYRQMVSCLVLHFSQSKHLFLGSIPEKGMILGTWRFPACSGDCSWVLPRNAEHRWFGR